MINDCFQIRIPLAWCGIFIAIFEKSAIMGIPDLKARLVRKILETNDKDVLNEIYRLLDSGNNDFYKNLTDDQKAEIELGLTSN